MGAGMGMGLMAAFLASQIYSAIMSSLSMEKQTKSTEKMTKEEREFQASLAQKKEAATAGTRAELKTQRQRSIKSKVKAESKMPGQAAAAQLSGMISQLMPLLMGAEGGGGGMEGAPPQGMQVAAGPQDAQALATTPIMGGGGPAEMAGAAGAGEPSAAMALEGGGQGVGAGTFEELMASIPGSTFSNPLMALRAQGWDLPSDDMDTPIV